MFKGTWKLEGEYACFYGEHTKLRKNTLQQLLTSLEDLVVDHQRDNISHDLFENQALHIAQGIALFAKDQPEADVRVFNNEFSGNTPIVKRSSAAIINEEEQFVVRLNDQLLREIVDQSVLIEVLGQRLGQITDTEKTYEKALVHNLLLQVKADAVEIVGLKCRLK